jgi:hypothetical protein
MRLVRWFLGVCLIPVGLAATHSIYVLACRVQPANLRAMPPAAWALAGGFAFWLFLYATLPRPMRTYVLAHELTHALWGWMMGGRVSKLKVRKDRGSVTLSKSNIWIVLAPYFFPFYTMCVIALYGVLSLFLDMNAYVLFWLGAIGFTWGFHVTFTVSTLLQRQTDVLQYGRVLSYALIYGLNVLGIGLWIVAVTAVTMGDLVDGLNRDLRATGRYAVDGLRHFGPVAHRWESAVIRWTR